MKRKKRREKGKVRRSRRGLSIIIMLVVVILALMASLVGVATDWLWFKSLGYTDVFWKKILTQLEIGIPVFIVATLLVRLYLKSLKKGYFRQVESHEIPNERRLTQISWGLSALFGLFSAIFTSNDTWMNFLKFSHSTNFNLADPLFHLDISFYVFKLAFLTQANNIVLGIIIGVVLITLIYYSILIAVRTPDIFQEDGEEEPEATQEKWYGEKDFGAGPKGNARDFSDLFKRKQNEQKRRKGHQIDVNSSNLAQLMHIASGKLTILGVVFYLMVAIEFLLRQFDLLHAHTGAVYGAGFTDVNITLWVYRGIMLISVIGGVMLVSHMHKREFRKLARAPLAIVLVGILGFGVSMAVQGLVVSPDEINKESKYLENNITYTRHAYDLDNVNVEEFPANQSLDAKAIEDNSQTISNIRINDYEPVKDFYNQTQSIRQYYDFNDVDVERYIVDGEETQTYLSAREINEKNISSTWINKHLKYTHGYGVAASRVDEVTSSGQPDIILKNIPPESSVKEIDITRPEIYFGELTDTYVIVNTDEQEFDYPNGNENNYTTYEGTAGIKLNPVNRLLFALREGSMKLLVSSNIHSKSRIIINRNIMARIQEIMPYLSYEEDPYLTMADGRLFWVVDAYTTSSYYPYSEPYSGEIGSTNYIRNSVKVVVDAYNGDVSYYIVDEDDPIAKTYQKIYPKLFKNYSDIPDSLKAHIRYPNTLFKIQANVYTKYHMNDVKVFYQNEDLWSIAHQIYGTEEKEMDPSYFVLELPDEKKAEFMNMVPFTPRSKQNMTAVMMARNDGAHYGEIVVYKFPKNKTVYGPMQIEAQIDQNTEISKEFSLWNSSGSKYRRGDLFVIPINDSLMYVEPVYLEASNQAIPEMKRVIVAYGDQIAYEPTLGAALEDLFGEGVGGNNGGNANSGAAAGTDKNSTKELIQKANEAYDNAVAAQKAGNWKKYGEYLKELEGYLDQLEQK